jgi:hypothetical protein
MKVSNRKMQTLPYKILSILVVFVIWPLTLVILFMIYLLRPAIYVLKQFIVRRRKKQLKRVLQFEQERMKKNGGLS